MAQDRSESGGRPEGRLTAAQRARLGGSVAHAELFRSSLTNEPIRVRCTCVLSADHWSEREIAAEAGPALRETLTSIATRLRRRR